MSIRRFKTLIAIAESGTFAEAARAMHLTPAAVSQQMKALESELDVALFDRSRRPPELNPAAHALVPRARELVRIYESIKSSVAGEIDNIDNLTIGTVPTSISSLMPLALKRLQAAQENLHVRIYPGLSDDLFAQVDRGFLDAAVLTEPRRIQPHLQWRPFTREPLVLLVSKDTVSDDPREILATQPYIRFARKAWVGERIDQWLSERGIQVREKMELDTLEATAAMVRNNLGVSIVPLNRLAMPDRRYFKVIDLGDDTLYRTLGVLCRRDTAKHALVELLWQELARISENGKEKAEKRMTRPNGTAIRS